MNLNHDCSRRQILRHLSKKNKVCYFMRIVCQQKILMKYHALFVIFEKQQNFKLSSAANKGGALWVKCLHAV